MATQRKKIISGALFFLIFFGAGLSVQAASLYFSPATGSFSVGRDFGVSVYVSSSDRSMNAVSGGISFPADKFEVKSLSKSGSIINLWVQEPSFSNTLGAIDFEGVVLNPGFLGSSGKVLTVNFRAKKEGTVPLIFSSSSVLANDGLGTNILTSLGTANYSVNGSQSAPKIRPAIKKIAANAPAAPVIVSSTHPDSNKWYSKNTAKFNWKTPKDIIATRLLLDEKPNSKPAIYYARAITQKTIGDLEDGILYFHSQLKNAAGWGSVAHFKIKIDTEDPHSLRIDFIEDRQTFDPSPAVFFSALDAVSGVAYYKISIDGNKPVKINSEISQNKPLNLPAQKPGEHTLFVEVYDRAGNSTAVSEEFVILEIDEPIITSCPSELKGGEKLVIEGETYPNSIVSVWLENRDGEIFLQQIKSGSDGLFALVWEDKVAKGIYKLWAGVTDEKGAESGATEKLMISVETTPMINYLTLSIILLILVLSIILNVYYKFYILKNTIRKEIKNVDKNIRKVFKILNHNIITHIKYLK
ncbi:MAG: hypothetical protein KAV41_02740, partial [Candidatus Pacebacteria bacterium]|nr:hypothetical protein [Candidatus Paceibacterota bacterium]